MKEMNNPVENKDKSKRLLCLYKISQVIDTHDNEDSPLELILSDIIDLIPHATEYPEMTSSRIIIDPVSFTTKDFRTPRNYLV